MPTNILVTGATGNVGKEVVRLLSDLDSPVTAAVRNPLESQSFGNNVRCVPFNFTNPDTFTNAFAEINKLFLVRPSAIAEIDRITPVLSAAKRAGIEEIVFLSIIGADKNRIVPHYKIERAILQGRGFANEQLDIPATFLRCSFFMQNLNTTHREDIRLRDKLFMPAGNGKTSFIDVRDIAAVAVKILIEEQDRSKGEILSNRAYDLTGAVALNYSEVATIFTTVLGRQIQYTNPAIPIFIWQMLKQGFPLQFVLVMVGIYTTARFGLADMVTSDVWRLLDRDPIKIDRYIEDYRQCWL